MMTFFLLYSLSGSVLWILVFIRVIKALGNISFFDRLSPPEPPLWPKLSIIVTACNEEKAIENAMKTLFKQSYPDFEIIAVNDRSTDRTGEILNSLAKIHWNLRVVHLNQLPSGWLGKVHALYKATEVSKGQWLLYTDADVHFRSHAIRKAMAYALSKNVDHFAIAPGLKTASFLLEVIINAFAGMFLLFTEAGKKEGRKRKRAVGVGAFNLVKKEALHRTEGFKWLKMEVADDVGLALMLKECGAKSTFALSREDVNLVWYERVRDMFVGLEKNIFGITSQYSYLRMALLFILTWAYALAPFAAVLTIRETYAGFIGPAAYLFLISASVRKKKKFGGSILADLFLPFGQIIISLMLLRSAFFCFMRGGIMWRGTLYRTEELKEGQRVRL